MNEKKYKLLESEKIEEFGRTLYRIVALKDFFNVRKGDRGGYVESGANLDQEGDCWVADNAWVYENARVYENATIHGNAQVYGHATVGGHATVSGDARVADNARVYEGASVSGSALVSHDANVYGGAWVYGNARVFENAKVYEEADVCDNAEVFGDARVHGDARVCEFAQVGGKAEVISDGDYLVGKDWWSSGKYFTWTKSDNLWKIGCFHGSGEELIKNAYTYSASNGLEYERIVKYVEEEVLKATSRPERNITQQSRTRRLR